MTNQSTGPVTDHQHRRHGLGDLYYFSLPVVDLPRAQRFFGAVLGWQFAGPDRGHVENISAPPGSLGGNPDDTAARLWFVVDDIRRAVATVRELGGTATDPVEYESGWAADCTDDQVREPPSASACRRRRTRSELLPIAPVQPVK